jgi:predicted metalloprotease with PDZ domain
MPSYHVDIDDTHSHHYRVTLRLSAPAPEQQLSLPVWIPGSYLVREFARHLSGLQAWQGGQPCTVTALDKSRWRIGCRGGGRLTVQYRVYAFDPSVRAAWLGPQRGFFNGTSLLLRVHGREAEPHRLTLGRLPAGWQVATAMPLDPAARRRSWCAADYDEAVDHPFELGPHWQGEFAAGGVPHRLVVSGAWPRFDGERLLADTRRVCEAVQAFWQGPATATPPALPFERYLFMLNTQAEGYGGLEHRASTALLAPRRDLPVQGVAPAGDGYTGLLGLVCHEYFHAWHVKRLKPAELVRIDYDREIPTRLLWLFEGFTTYYEDLLLRRAGLVDAATCLRRLARRVQAVAATPGRRVQSVADASFDAWTKAYRPDENTPNATVSYYAKGALVALALDLTLRRRGHSLDDVMRALWRATDGGPVTEADLLAAVHAVAGRRLRLPLAAWVHGTGELPLPELLSAMGIRWHTEPAPWAAALGLQLSEGPVTGVQVRQVLAGGAAAAAGLAAGDELLAVDGWRIRRLDEALGWVARDQPVDLLLVRDQQVLTRQLRPADLPGQVQLTLEPEPGRPVLARRRRWIDA